MLYVGSQSSESVWSTEPTIRKQKLKGEVKGIWGKFQNLRKSHIDFMLLKNQI